MSIRTTAEALWDMLDAIDTVDDSAHTDANFRREVMRIAKLRFAYGGPHPRFGDLHLERDAPFFCNFCHHIKQAGEVHQPSDDFCLLRN